MAFTNEQLERYSRHIILKEVGAKGQKKLLNAKVLVIGAGGLGAPVAMYLAAAGVGTIGIADADVVDLSNLQRQIIHATADVGKPKVQSAKETMEAMNPDVKVITYHTFVTSENILDLIKDYDFIIDGTDNFPAKFLINDACVMAKKPFSHAGIIRFQGQLMTYVPGQGPCYRRQVHSRRGQFAHGLPAHLQCAHDGIPQGKTADAYRRLRCLRNAPDHHAAYRLRTGGLRLETLK